MAAQISGVISDIVSIGVLRRLAVQDLVQVELLRFDLVLGVTAALVTLIRGVRL